MSGVGRGGFCTSTGTSKKLSSRMGDIKGAARDEMATNAGTGDLIRRGEMR